MPPSKGKPLNVVLIMTDQLRVDYMGPKDGSPSLTPHIDSLCNVHNFARCNSVNPICQPTRTALLTGRYSRQIGTLRMSGDLPKDIPTFTQALQKEGYHTIGVGKFHYLQGWPWDAERGEGHNLVNLRPHFHEWGFDDVWQVCGKSQLSRNYCDYAKMLDDRGVLEKYRDDLDSRGKNLSNAEIEQVDCTHFKFDSDLYVDRVIADQSLMHIEKRPQEKPFFAQISFCGPHPPYDPPKDYLDKVEFESKDNFLGDGMNLSPKAKQVQYEKRRAYKAMIQLVDDQVGRVSEYLKNNNLIDNTVIIFTCDHGEMMGDHMLSQKSASYWPSVRVPMMVNHPDYREKKQHDCLVENLDITATILDIAGIDSKSSLGRLFPGFMNLVPSQSLMPIIKGECEKHREFIFSECNAQWECIETDNYKYTRFLQSAKDKPGRDVLWDLKKDPGEETNLSADPSMHEVMMTHREYLNQIREMYPAVQTNWAPAG